MYNLSSVLILTLLASSALASLTFFLLVLTSNPKSESRVVVVTTPHVHKNMQLIIARSHCEGTLHLELCISTLSSFPDLHRKSIAEIISSTVKVTVGKVRDSAHNCSDLRRDIPKLEPIERRALEDCVQLLEDAISELRTALTHLSAAAAASKHVEIQTLLSAAMTNEDTCLDGLLYTKNNLSSYVEDNLHTISHHVSNSLAMLNKIKSTTTRTSLEMKNSDGFPKWLNRLERALLHAPVNQTKFNLVVAKDGTGNFTTINDALSAAPNSSTTRFIIYIKEGSYFENVVVHKKKTMIMFVGDGIGKTKIKDNRNHVDGWTTFRSATLAVVGKGFLAKGVTVENYSGPSKGQAVALRSGSDLSAFYQCSFIAYQDTLYVHSLRQFYRDCDVYGTVDFIFGNAAVVLQNCNLYARKPNPRQKNVFTAQGRKDPNQNTGISMLKCKVEAAADLIPVQSSYKNYLGRPWKEYSRTVYMGSYIGSLIEPVGWLEWNGDFALRTLYYGEYMNRGPGSNTSDRVNWPGYRVINTSTEATQFTVGNFIQGEEWLPATGFPFYLNFTSSHPNYPYISNLSFSGV